MDNRASLLAQMVKNLPAMQETWVPSLGWEDSLEKGMATHSRILARRIPWSEEPGGLQSMGSQRVGHDWTTNTHFVWINSLFPELNQKLNRYNRDFFFKTLKHRHRISGLSQMEKAEQVTTWFSSRLSRKRSNWGKQPWGSDAPSTKPPWPLNSCFSFLFLWLVRD